LANAHSEHSNPYMRLLWMTALSFVSMYILMYAMVAAFSDVYNSVNQVYMAGLMTAPMVAIELLLMRPMYPNGRLNLLLIAAAVVAGVLFWMLIRQQGAVTDSQFLRSMIPHHSGAVLMCDEASLRDARVQKFCRGIIAGQRAEIAEMKALLAQPLD
jgi:uncharacterized protein (DUF305 family)